MRRARLVAALAATALAAGCSSGDDTATNGGTTVASTASPHTDRSPAPRTEGRATVVDPDEPTGAAQPLTEAPDDGAGPGTTPRPDGPTTSPTHHDTQAPVDADHVCRQVPGPRVAEALGVGEVVAHPRDSETPQCAYVFEGQDGVPTNATIAVLRPGGDLGGRTGAEAFDHVVATNRRAAQAGSVVETVVSVGDRALLLSSENLHFGVVQFGPRIVTTIVEVRVADVAAAVSLVQATGALAP